MLEDRALVEESLNSADDWASFLTDSLQHDGDWLFALPVGSCGLRLDNEAVRVAVGSRLALDLCVPHHCHCGFPVDSHGLQSFVCKESQVGLRG